MVIAFTSTNALGLDMCWLPALWGMTSSCILPLANFKEVWRLHQLQVFCLQALGGRSPSQHPLLDAILKVILKVNRRVGTRIQQPPRAHWGPDGSGEHCSRSAVTMLSTSWNGPFSAAFCLPRPHGWCLPLQFFWFGGWGGMREWRGRLSAICSCVLYIYIGFPIPRWALLTASQGTTSLRFQFSKRRTELGACLSVPGEFSTGLLKAVRELSFELWEFQPYLWVKQTWKGENREITVESQTNFIPGCSGVNAVKRQVMSCSRSALSICCVEWNDLGEGQSEQEQVSLYHSCGLSCVSHHLTLSSPRLSKVH